LEQSIFILLPMDEETTYKTTPEGVWDYFWCLEKKKKPVGY
jgi:hypothetical protein